MTKTKQKILVVEDEVDLAEQVKNVLLQLNLNVSVVHSGTAALEKLKSESFDLLFTDVRLPGLDGLQLLEALRKAQLTLPVILVSGNADKEMAIQGVKLGAIDFIEKPFRAQEVVTAVNNALQKGANQFRTHLEKLDLSEIQLKILELVFKGIGNKDIAGQVHLSEQGVKYHMGMLFQRYNVKNRNELKVHVRDLLKK